ncbi:hypothetical protein JDV02_006657 [Purpureocillium takamizusanense]|uniref:GPI anchored protein n=1 Tax=Purpureocillium takamizusanense TaxID=2060973 RepID=A0A9Q8VBJ4_9HYPO|nr:uncharacterized protein JDV02_006657 [Purpureocillium takamizusanense]UNI20585.1 hypothetical protein JDV02_006657 [Purpureocillium takamizusanense]
MAPPSSMLLLPASILALVSQAAAAQQVPTAVKKLSLDSSEKIFPEHLAFAPLLLSSAGGIQDSDVFLRNLNHHSYDDDEDAAVQRHNGTERVFRPAFARHLDDGEEQALRRAAAALALLRKRAASCPTGMTSCADQGSPNKCCQKGTYCTDVPDTMVGHVACCPDGSKCGGGVGDCPAGATSCPADLGGGCCIPGYVCQGVGCVPSASATQSPSAPLTITSTQTTMVGGSPSTVIVTLTVTRTSSAAPTTETQTTTVTASGGGSATGRPPWRQTGSSSDSESTSATTTAAPTSQGEPTQTGCPTGFYGCMATHGGGCCRTDRDCQTHDCPAGSSTTLVSGGLTVVVPATDVPKATASATCAGGWFLCGKDAGPVAGCCPSGYDCGTASCFTAGASQTGSVQKEAPEKGAAAAAMASGAGLRAAVVVAVGVWVLLAVA